MGMYWPNINNLKEFYKTPLGAIACRTIRSHIHDLWPEVGSGANLKKPEYIAGIGFTAPYMTPFIDNDTSSSYQLICVMPQAQGVCHWPKSRKNRAVMCDENELPFDDESMDRILVIHALEYCNDIRHFMRESWRILKANGKIIIVVPNRRGLWARAENTPFGHGRPFSHGQLKQLFIDTIFMPRNISTNIYLPPTRSKIILNSAPAIEKLGKKAFKPFGGIIVAEAEKQLYSATPVMQEETGFVAATDGAE